MISLTLAEIADATGGVVVDANPQVRVDGPVVMDSRRCVPGSLFVAHPGEHVDGHDFAAAAVAAGAVAVLANKPVGGPAVVVPDVVRGLGLLAHAVLQRLPEVVVVGITGSTGKTSTKDLIGQLLAQLGPTVAPEGSFNNETGLPLTVLRADATTKYLVLEASARGVGHIRYLCGIARPDLALVLNVGAAHLGEFGSREVVAAAKGELVEALAEGGVAVLNADDDAVLAMRSRAHGEVVTFGRAESADVRAVDVHLDGAARASFLLCTPGGQAPVSLQLHGEHHVANALAAATVATRLGMDTADVAAALSAATPLSRWRMEVHARPDGVTVVNDAYNANPDSMAAALRAVAAMAGTGDGEVRTWAVLGEMAELGEAATAEHEALGRLAAQLGITRVVAVGPGAAGIHRGAADELARGSGMRTRGVHEQEAVQVPDAQAALALVASALRQGDVVLVKASRSVGLERLADGLLEAGQPAAGGAR